MRPPSSWRARISSATASAPIPTISSAARVALGTVRVSNLDARDHVDFLMALGEALFFEDDYGAAAALFESGIDGADRAGPADRRGDARLVGQRRRAPRRRARARCADRRRSRACASAWPASWRAIPAPPRPRTGSSSARAGRGEPVAAWDAAIAGWVRARLAGARSATLRADLDKLVLEGIIPDRVRAIAADRRAQAESDLRAEWAVVKERWK